MRSRLKILMHVIARARQRCGVELSYIDVGNINARLRRGEGVQFSATDHSRGILLGMRDGTMIPFVFDTNHECVRTVLPTNCRQARRARKMLRRKKATDGAPVGRPSPE